MKRVAFIILTLISLLHARQITTSDSSNTPWRERMLSNVSSAMLIGVPGTSTATDTCVGTYVYTFQMHQFPVEKSGYYLLYEDVLGGTSYSRRTDWSTISGKYVTGADALYRQRSVTTYGTIMKAAYNDRGLGGTLELPGTIIGEPGTAEVMRDTTIHTSSNQTYSLYGHSVDWAHYSYWDKHPWDWSVLEFGNGLFYSSLDTNLTISGGYFYGNSDVNYIDGTVHGALSSNTQVSINSTTGQFAADSLLKWYIIITSGTGSGQSMRVMSNTATVGDTTLINVTSSNSSTVGWVTKPNATSHFRLTPMEEYNFGIDINKGKNIRIKDVHIDRFSGDGISVSGSQDVWIDNCIIDTPYGWFYKASGSYQNLVGRQGITLSGGTTGHWFDQPSSTLISGMDTLKNVRITKCRIRGGVPGGIDLEPLGRAYIENLEISDCDIEAYSVGITIYVSDSTRIKNVTIKNNRIKSYGWGIYLMHASAVKMDSTTVTEAIDGTEYEWDVSDTSFVPVGGYIMIDQEICRVQSKVDGNTISLYNSGGSRLVYGGSALATHSTSTKVYRMNGPGTDYGYIDNLQILNNTIESIGNNSGYGILLTGNNYRNVKISGNVIRNWIGRGFEVTGVVKGMEITNNLITNCGIGYGLGNTFYPGAVGCNSVVIKNNWFRDNAVAADSAGSQLYLSTIGGLVVAANTFECSVDSTIRRGIFVYNCDSVIVANNCLFGHQNDDPLFWASSATVSTNNVAGFSSSSGAGSTAADMVYSYGNTAKGDSLAAEKYETKRTVLRFNGYRDAIPHTAGAKIVAQNVAWPGFGGSPWKVQSTNLLFYTLTDMAYSVDDTRLRMLITAGGIGLPDSSYISFFNKNSKSESGSGVDTLWASVNSNGYGLREMGGKVQAKNSGRSWYQVLSFVGSKNKNYQAEVGDLWMSSKRDTLWYKTHADTSWYILVGGHQTGKH